MFNHSLETDVLVIGGGLAGLWALLRVGTPGAKVLLLNKGKVGITSIDSELCNGCGICVDVCPMDVLRMNHMGEKAVIVYPLDCTTCFNCERECDPGAIYVSPERAREVALPW